MESEEILKLSKRIYRFLHRRNWSHQEIEDLHSYMLLKALDGTSKNHNSFRFIYFDAVKSLFPIKERDNDTVENNIDRIVYEYDFDTKIQVQKTLTTATFDPPQSSTIKAQDTVSSQDPGNSSYPDLVLKDQLNSILDWSVGRSVFTLRYVLLDILKAWENRLQRY